MITYDDVGVTPDYSYDIKTSRVMCNTTTMRTNMPDNTIKRHHFRHIQLLCTVILIALLLLSFTNIFKEYRADQDALACDNARFVIWDRYIIKCNEAIDSGTPLDEINKSAYLSEVITSLYDKQITANDDGSYTCSGICPNGGTYTISINDETNVVTIDCSTDGHEESVSW